VRMEGPAVRTNGIGRMRLAGVDFTAERAEHSEPVTTRCVRSGEIVSLVAAAGAMPPMPPLRRMSRRWLRGAASTTPQRSGTIGTQSLPGEGHTARPTPGASRRPLPLRGRGVRAVKPGHDDTGKSIVSYNGRSVVSCLISALVSTSCASPSARKATATWNGWPPIGVRARTATMAE
jgi:hypothetical protein